MRYKVTQKYWFLFLSSVRQLQNIINFNRVNITSLLRKNPSEHFTQCPVNYVVFLLSLVEIVTIHLVWAWGIVLYTLVVSFPDCKYSPHIEVLIKTAKNLISLCSSFLRDSVLYTLVSFVSYSQLILLKTEIAKLYFGYFSQCWSLETFSRQ